MINKRGVIFPVCPCVCSVLTSASKLFGDEERMQDWQNAMWVLQSQRGLVARASFMEEPHNDLCFLWPFLCDVGAVRGSSRVSVLLAVSPLVSQTHRDPWLFYKRRSSFPITLKYIQQTRASFLQTRPLLTRFLMSWISTENSAS